MKRITRDIEIFTDLVLDQVPNPWTADVTLDVFETIRKDESLMQQDRQLVDTYDEKAKDPQGVVNVWIAKNVKKLTGLESETKPTRASKEALITAYRKLHI